MLDIVNLSFSYRDKEIFDKVNLKLAGSEIVAVIGDNGAGKTTLLRLIAGELEPDDGVIKVWGEVGFLRQTQDDITNKSGGEKTQLRLAEIMRKQPQILLLDEPTNNLDTGSKTRLIKSLRKYHGLVIVVSHDRDFINAVADKVACISEGKIEIITGNYDDYLIREEQKRNELAMRYENAQREKKRLYTQLKAARDQAHKSNRRSYNKLTDESKLQYNGKRMAAQNNAGKILRATKSRLEQLAEVEKPWIRKTYAARMENEIEHKRKILKLRDLAKSYNGRVLFGDANLEVWTNERVRVAGRNGAGKSTMFRIITGEVTQDAGEVWIAPDMKVGYIAQDRVGLEMGKSFLAQVSGIDKAEIYQAAATMDLAPEEINRPVGELSRGQQTKLMILKLILKPLNLVILDEMTNHLDIRARENIEAALERYHGAILFATHDETFARKLRPGRTVELG